MKTAFEQPDGTVKWVNYQDLPGTPGDRKLEDRQKFIESDFKDASVLDLGCWGGQMMLEAKRLGAKEVLGIEIDKDIIGKGRELGNNIIMDDLENPFIWRRLAKFDVVLCLAILGNMKNKVAVLSNASQLADTMYVEGHGVQHNFSRADWVELFLTYTTFRNIEYLGNITTRPFFRLTRNPIDIDYILGKKYKRIALIGKPGSGKTYLTKFFKWYKIFSDIEDIDLSEDKIVVDNHGALNLADFDCVINVVADREKRVERILGRHKGNVSKEEAEKFADTLSPPFVKGTYDYYTINN